MMEKDRNVSQKKEKKIKEVFLLVRPHQSHQLCAMCGTSHLATLGLQKKNLQEPQDLLVLTKTE